jgi:hypothetical protein
MKPFRDVAGQSGLSLYRTLAGLSLLGQLTVRQGT